MIRDIISNRVAIFQKQQCQISYKNNNKTIQITTTVHAIYHFIVRWFRCQLYMNKFTLTFWADIIIMCRLIWANIGTSNGLLPECTEAIV